MSQQVPFNQYTEKVLAALPKGVFLTTAFGGKTNTMTIGWANIGFMWGEPVVTVMVRPSRHTYHLINQSNEFTVSIPLHDMKEALGICGSKSGRDCDKITLAGLTPVAGQNINTPVIGGAGLHYECRVVYKQAMDPQALNPDLAAKWYGSGDFHTLYYGQIVACYKDD